MSSVDLMHPVDTLSPLDRWRLYYYRVVELAVAQGMLPRDPDTEIGHFAFSRYYAVGNEIDQRIKPAIRHYNATYPKHAQARLAHLDKVYHGAATEYLAGDPAQKRQDLIRIGASYRVWPTGTGFTLTYPWDLEGRAKPVRFRTDLSDFMKRRIVEVLEGEGKLRNPNLFRTD